MPTGDSTGEADLYRKLRKGIIQCQSCAHYCVLKSGERGRCGVKQNINGELYSLLYGKACAANIEPNDKKPFFISCRVPVLIL